MFIKASKKSTRFKFEINSERQGEGKKNRRDMYAHACHSYQLSLFLKTIINIISYVEELP